MSIEVIDTAAATVTGGCRDGQVKSGDGRIGIDARPPKALGGSGEGANPEQLFTAKGGFGLTGKIVGHLPGVEQVVADDLVHRAHQVCLYSKATKGNVAVAAKV